MLKKIFLWMLAMGILIAGVAGCNKEPADGSEVSIPSTASGEGVASLESVLPDSLAETETPKESSYSLPASPQEPVSSQEPVSEPSSVPPQEEEPISIPEEEVSEESSGAHQGGETTIHFEDGKSYTFGGPESEELTALMTSLNYDPLRFCKCLPEYRIDIETGFEYGIRLDGERYARSKAGQIELTEEQGATAARIIEWAREKAQ